MPRDERRHSQDHHRHHDDRRHSHEHERRRSSGGHHEHEHEHGHDHDRRDSQGHKDRRDSHGHDHDHGRRHSQDHEHENTPEKWTIVPWSGGPSGQPDVRKEKIEIIVKQRQLPAKPVPPHDPGVTVGTGEDTISRIAGFGPEDENENQEESEFENDSDLESYPPMTNIGICNNCHVGRFVKKFTWTGMVASLICFPCGIYYCYKSRNTVCSYCGIKEKDQFQEKYKDDDESDEDKKEKAKEEKKAKAKEKEEKKKHKKDEDEDEEST